MKKAMKRRDRESGQSLVEFALVVPLLFLLLFGSIEFGRVFHAQLVITSAAREGARKAIVTGNASLIEDAVKKSTITLKSGTIQYFQKTKADLEAGIPPNSNTVWYAIDYPDDPPGVRTYGNSVAIYVKARVDIIVPLISSIIGNPRPIPANAVMRVETG